MLATLNIVIGLVFVLLMFSLLASTVMEVIAAMLSLRAKHLRRTLQNMLGDKMEDFITHPFFRQISFASNNHKAKLSNYKLPTWINKDTFTVVLQDIMNATNSRDLEAKIKSLDEGDLKHMMEFMFRQAGGDPRAFKAQVERWFDEVMERASEWYKRTLKWWLFGVGFVLAAIFNADTIQMYQNISSNATVQQFLVDMATQYEAKTDSVGGPNLQLSVEESIARMDSSLQQIEHIRSPLGLGWTSPDANQKIPWWLVKFVGLLITGIAVTFGAPFWFDVLRKLLTLRGSAPEKPASAAPKQPAHAPESEHEPAKTEKAVKSAPKPPPADKDKSAG